MIIKIIHGKYKSDSVNMSKASDSVNMNKAPI